MFLKKHIEKNNDQVALCQLRMSFESILFSANKTDRMKVTVTDTSIITK